MWDPCRFLGFGAFLPSLQSWPPDDWGTRQSVFKYWIYGRINCRLPDCSGDICISLPWLTEYSVGLTSSDLMPHLTGLRAVLVGYLWLTDKFSPSEVSWEMLSKWTSWNSLWMREDPFSLLIFFFFLHFPIHIYSFPYASICSWTTFTFVSSPLFYFF